MGIKISQLPAATVATVTDLLEAVQNGVSVKITVQMLVDLAKASASPIGTVQAFAGATVPTGWFLCDGSSKLKTTYAALYAVIGNTYGSDSTTFKVPDLRGEFIRGLDSGRGVDSGRSLGTAQGQTLQLHAHPYSTKGSTPIVEAGNDYLGWTGTGTGNTGATGSAETRPRNVALNYIIKY